MSINAIGSSAAQAYHPTTSASAGAAVELPNDRENDGDADDGAATPAVTASSMLPPGVGNIIDQHA